MKQDLNHQNIRKICSITAILLVILAAASLSVRPQPTYECLEWKFKIVDDWWNWGASAAKYDPVTGAFGAVAYLYNSTPPPGWTGAWSFENWYLRGQGVANPDGWVTICLPRSWDRTPAGSGDLITYTLIVKLMIGGEVTPITIYNGTILVIGEQAGDIEFIGLETLLDDTITTSNGIHPTKGWITAGTNGVNRANGTTWYQGKTRGIYKMWLYYVAMQPLDELGFPITGATLEVRYNSSYDDHIVNSKPGTYVTNVLEEGWNNKFYGKWVTNGSLGSEFVPDPTYIYHANYGVGWVVLRVPMVNTTTAPDSLYRSSLVSNLTFIWRFKTGTPINVTYYTMEFAPIDFAPPTPWGHLVPAAPPSVGSYSDYFGPLMVNSTHQVNATVRWVKLDLLDCYGNMWWTKKAELYAFDSADKNQYHLAGAEIAPGMRVLRYPVPVPPFGNTTLVLGVEWYYSLVNVSKWVVGYDPVTLEVYDELDPQWGWSKVLPRDEARFGLLINNIMEYDEENEEYVQLRYNEIKNNMTWVDVNFWSAAELPQPVPDFAAKIKLPSTTGYRKADPITVWWNGRNGFVVLPDMEWYSGPNPATLTEMDPWAIASNTRGFSSFYTVMKLVAGGFYNGDGNGWLPTREVGWVDFEAYYEGMKVLDTYAEGNSLKLPCCESSLPSAGGPGSTECHYNLTMKIYELGFRIILEACGKQMDAPTGVPFFFKHPGLSTLDPNEPLTGPKAVTEGKVDIVKAPKGNYSNFAIVWQMSVLTPYKILYRLDNGTDIPLTEPIALTENMRNIQLYFKLWNLTIDPWSQDPFRLINVNVTLFSVSNFQFAPGVGISQRQLDQITDAGPPPNIAYHHVLPEGWVIYHRTTSGGFPVIYYHTDTQTNHWNTHPSWQYLPEKEYWIWVRVPGALWNDAAKKWNIWDRDQAERSGFRRVDANATLYWSGDPWNKPLYLNQCYGWSSPLILETYVYNPRFAVKTACGEPLVFTTTDNAALILAEPWYSTAEPNNLFYRQQINPYVPVFEGAPGGGGVNAQYNAYLVRKNATDSGGVVTISSVNASSISPPNDPDLWNPKTGWKAEKYPNQSRYLIGYSPGSWPILPTEPDYRIMVYYKGVLVFNVSMVLSNPYVDKANPVKTSVYPYVFRATNDPLPGGTVFGVANINVTVYWPGLNMTWWPTKHLAFESAPIEFSLLNASKLEKGFNMSVVKRLWGPYPTTFPDLVQLEWLPRRPDICPPYFSDKVVIESKLTDSEGKAVFLIPVWNYSVTPNIYTWVPSIDSVIDPVNLVSYVSGPRNPWNLALGPLSVNLLTAGSQQRVGALFGTPVYANFTTVPGLTNNIPAADIVRLSAVLNASRYCPWIQYSMNATGLVNPATKTWENTRCKMTWASGASVWRDGVSLNTTYRVKYIGEWWAGVGMLVGGAYQHRAPDSETGTTVSQGEDGCYAKAEERVPANDLGVVVRNLDKVGLPNQKVTVIREAIYVDSTLISPKTTLLEDWTPTTINADPADYYALYLRSTPSNILWGFYAVTLRTENLTRGMTNTLLKLNDPQFLTVTLPGGEVDWVSSIYHLDWPARLKVTILTEDGRPVEKAWVYVVDGYTKGNVTAAITDTYGHAGTLYVGLGEAPPSPSIYMEPGDRVDIGFNLLRGWYWVDEHRALTGVAVNPVWDRGDKPYEPDGSEYIDYINYGEEEGWARFYGRYYVVVYYKPAGCSEVLGPVTSEVVFDSYTDEPQHQYIYLGVTPETVTGEASYSASQAKTWRAYVNDLRISFEDGMNRPLTHVTGGARHPKYGWDGVLTFNSGDSNTVTLTMVPLRPGTSYAVHAEWASKYGTTATVDSSVKDLYSVVMMPVFDVTLRLVTPRGSSLVGVGVKVAGVDVGATSATGEVLVTQIPSGTYAVSAKWLGTDLNVPSLVVTTNGAVTLTPSNVHVLTVAVRGAQGQALEGATVRVTKGTVEITKLTDKDGKAEIELPDASYDIAASYGQFTGSSSVSLNADKIVTINLDVFIEFLGVGMSMAQFLLFIVMAIVIVIVLAIVIHEYHVYRRKRLPQLFGAPSGPK